MGYYRMQIMMVLMFVITSIALVSVSAESVNSKTEIISRRQLENTDGTKKKKKKHHGKNVKVKDGESQGADIDSPVEDTPTGQRLEDAGTTPIVEMKNETITTTTTTEEQVTMKNPCVDILTCKECSDYSTNNITCDWVTGSSGNHECVGMPRDISKPIECPMEVNDDGDDDSPVPVFAIFFGLILTAYFVKTRYFSNNHVLTSGSVDGFSTAGNSTISGSLTSVFPSRRYNQETVPLSSTTTDDEWGWEESTGHDVEMANINSKEDEELQLALAMSLADSSRSNSAPPSQNRPPFMPKRPTGGTLAKKDSWDDDSAWNEEATSARRKDSWDDESVPSPPKPNTTATTSNVETIVAGNHLPPGSYITSLAKPKPPAALPPPRQQPQNDDIFASMGLAPQPKFASKQIHSAPVSSPFPAKSNLAQSSSVKSTSHDDLDVNDKWDDDADLDDLLDE